MRSNGAVEIVEMKDEDALRYAVKGNNMETIKRSGVRAGKTLAAALACDVCHSSEKLVREKTEKAVKFQKVECLACGSSFLSNHKAAATLPEAEA